MATEKQKDILYEKLLDTCIILRDVHYRFQPYSARDIKTLIDSKLKSKKEEFEGTIAPE